MIECAGVQPDSIWTATPAVLNDLAQKPFSQALADIRWEQSELHNLNLSQDSAIQFSESGIDARDLKHMQFVERVVNDRQQFRIS
jgi:hypothetical protein